MPRAIWSGAISFGLVNVPVKLFSATEQKDVRFHQFEEGTGERIRYRRVAEGTGEEVDYDRIVKGYEISKGQFVMVTREELEAVEPGKTRTIDIEDFVDLDEIDPIFFEKTYYLAPDGDAGAAKPYVLLLDAMERSGRVAIARFVMRTKQYLAAIRASDGLLVLETMFFPDEIRDRTDLVPGRVEVNDRERDVAARLVESLSSRWEPEQYHDTYRERVLDLVHRKAEGEEVVVPAAREDEGKVVDLMAALEASVEAARGRRSGGARAAASGEGERYVDLTKEELYEEAQKRDIAGRSKMSRDELVDALRCAS